jgi:hypothetical protein
MLMPVVFLFGLESYLGRYDVHSKYLNELKDTLLNYGESQSKNYKKSLTEVVANIDKGNFSEAARCLRAGRIGGQRCNVDNVNSNYKSISNIDIIKGGWNDRSKEYINDFKDNILKKRVDNGGEIDFDFDYNFLDDSDTDSWLKFNHGTSGKRFGYFNSNEVDNNTTYINGGNIFQPALIYSNVKPIKDGRVRILAISDSNGAGDGLLSVDDVWAKELEYQLNLIEDKYEVYILAQGGGDYNDFLRWVEEGYIDEINPDLVMMSYFGSDFNLLRDFENMIFTKGNGGHSTGLDTGLVFYLQCFEKDDDFIGSKLKIVSQVFPHLYRFYKFSRCGDNFSELDDDFLIDKVAVVESYKRIDKLINVPTFLFQIQSNIALKEGSIKREILREIENNGIVLINKAEGKGGIESDECGTIFTQDKQVCEAFRANTFDWHYNRYYYKLHIGGRIKEIKESIDSSLSGSSYAKIDANFSNKSEHIIVDYLPNTLFVYNESRERSSIGLFKGDNYGYGRSSENFCVPFDRKGVVLNFNRYLTEGKEIKISSEYQGSGLGLVSRGYDSEGRVVYGEAIELLPGKPVTLRGGESVRGVVVLSNSKNCGSSDRKNNDEFLLQVEVL